jgi:hypothetical protein
MFGRYWQCAGDLGTSAFESWAEPEKIAAWLGRAMLFKQLLFVQ